MNRAEAEHILDAYVLLSTTNMEAASDSLRNVILDAMTTVRYWPYITTPNKYTLSDSVTVGDLLGGDAV